MPSQQNCKLRAAWSGRELTAWLYKMIAVWHKLNRKEVTSYFPGWLLRSLQCGRRKWQKSVTVYRQLSSYSDYADQQTWAPCYDCHVSLMFTRSWFHFVMGKEGQGQSQTECHWRKLVSAIRVSHSLYVPSLNYLLV